MAWQDASDSGASVCPLVSIARARSAKLDRVFGLLQACVVMPLTLALLTLHTLECPSGAVLSSSPVICKVPAEHTADYFPETVKRAHSRTRLGK